MGSMNLHNGANTHTASSFFLMIFQLSNPKKSSLATIWNLEKDLLQNDSRIQMDFGFSCPVFPEIMLHLDVNFIVHSRPACNLQRCWLNVFCDKRGRIQCCSGSGCG